MGTAVAVGADAGVGVGVGVAAGFAGRGVFSCAGGAVVWGGGAIPAGTATAQ